MKEFGAALRKAREAAGLTIRQLYERTRINQRYLDAIERGALPPLPQTYVRAFIRDYAIEVGLDEDSVLAEYDRLIADQLGSAPQQPRVDTSHLIPQLDDTIEIVSHDEEPFEPPIVSPQLELLDRKETIGRDLQRGESFPEKRKFSLLDLQEIPPKEPPATPPPPVSAAPEKSIPHTIELEHQPAEKSSRVEVPIVPHDKTGTAPEPTPTPKAELKSDASPELKHPTLIETPSDEEIKPKAPEAPATKTEATPILPVQKETSSRSEQKIVTTPSEKPKPTTEDASAPRPTSRRLLDVLLRGEAKQRSKAKRPQRVYDTKPIPQSERADARIPTSSVSKPVGKPPAPPPQKPKRLNDGDRIRRQRIAAWLIIIIIVIAVYAIIKFGTQPAPVNTAEADSARARAMRNAQSFIDSTQYFLPQPTFNDDTLPAQNPKEEQAMEPVKQKFVAEDSLILEAFSTAPVWFSIRMDTTRSERGSMLANDRRVWKAKDKFVVTLGDAGSVTFVLNGKELGPLGESGMVVRNAILSRQQVAKLP